MTTRLLFGPLAAVILLLGVTVLGAMVPGYDQVRQTVSEVGEIGSPVRVPFAVLLCVVALCVLVFATALHAAAVAGRRSPSSSYLVAAMAFSIAGVGLFAFPHPLHNVFGISELIGYQAPLLFAITWRGVHNARTLVAFSWILYGLSLVAIALNLYRQGPIGAYLAPIYGLLQRALFVTWFGWVALIGIGLARRTGSKNADS